MAANACGQRPRLAPAMTPGSHHAHAPQAGFTAMATATTHRTHGTLHHRAPSSTMPRLQMTPTNVSLFLFRICFVHPQPLPEIGPPLVPHSMMCYLTPIRRNRIVAMWLMSCLLPRAPYWATREVMLSSPPIDMSFVATAAQKLGLIKQCGWSIFPRCAV